MILAAGSAPKMTMSQILKQTKKCCSKIIRKLSFHTNGVNGPSSSSSCGVGSNNGGTGALSGGRSISLNNRATTKYVLHKNCTPTRCKVQPTSPERFGAGPSWMSEDDSPVRRRLDLSPSANEQPDIPATQNNYRVSRDGKNLPKKRTNITSNKNVNLRKCFRMRKGFKEELGEEELNNSASVASSKLDKISKTLYHAGGSGVAEHRDGEIIYTNDGKLINLANNLASQTSEKSKISKPLFLSGKHKNYNQIETEFGAELDYDEDDDELVACEMDAIRTATDVGRLQFELSQPLPEAHVSPLPGRSHYEDIVFEKVKFDHNKRYLRTGSPSTASNRSHPGVVQSADSLLSINQLANKSDDFVDPWRNYNVSGTRWNKVAKNPWEIEAQKVDSPTPISPLRQASWNPFNEEESITGVTPPKVYPPPYQVRTDIWQNLNNKNYEIDSDVVWRTSSSNSRRTSASTVETWIEDEVFDNSFNEELERRCATLQI